MTPEKVANMNENESRPLERWSMGQIMWSGRTSEFVNAYATSDKIDVLREKAAALAKILAAWGMTWDEYRTNHARRDMAEAPDET